MKGIFTLVPATLVAATLCACGSYAPRPMEPNPNDPAQIARSAGKAYYECLEAKSASCADARARMIQADKAAKDAEILRIRSLGGRSFKIGSE
ncbi:hypothetical protein [Cupriavidus sp. HPC(L)]|uniref:hypothetical protein n=1 Tax=Cupriavidus sp. HPC(L) TaxID=1217418 RepID=UPI0012ED96E1|nr:hypothetical protein [Cupriavidus sp. HPC(L)]